MTLQGTSHARAEATVSGLDETFDDIIRTMPATIFGAPDEAVCTPEFSRNPYPFFEDLRNRAGPIVRMGEDGTYAGTVVPDGWGHDPADGMYVALTHAAVTEIGTDTARFKNDTAYAASQAIQGSTVQTLDGAEHRMMRRLMDQAVFGRKQMQEYLDSLTVPVTDYVISRIERMLANGEEVELCRDLAVPLVYKSISTILGVPARGLRDFIHLGDDAFGFLRNPQRAMEAIQELAVEFGKELEEHKTMESPPRDFMTIMLDSDLKGYKLSEEEIIMHCRFLLPGGIETTWRQTANMMMAMMLHPEQWRQVTEDLTLVDKAVEESLRWCPSGWIVPRRVVADCEVQGVFLQGGAAISSQQGFANRDPDVWERPNEFDIHRPLKQHLTFHTGVHFCMGQNLARNSFRTALAELARRIPDLTLACDPSKVEMCGYGIRVVRRLPVKRG